MTDNHDDSHASRLHLRRWRLATGFDRLSVLTSSHTVSADSAAMRNSTPDPEMNEYGNIQTTKVIAGLDFGVSNKCHDEAEMIGAIVTTSPINEQTPVVDIDFSILGLPNTMALPTVPTMGELFRILLRPPAHAFLHGVLSIQWVIGAIGQSHFDFRESDERYVLRPGSEIRLQGRSLGLPEVYLEWLCGDEEESSPTEQSMLLTENFFDETRKEMEDCAEDLEVGQ